MNIGIDIDDTISETYEVLLPYSQKYSIEDLKKRPCVNLKEKSKDHFYIKSINGWSHEECEKFWEKYYPEMMEKVNIKAFAAETINELREEGQKIFLISARWNMENFDNKEVTLRWLKNNDLTFDELILDTPDKLQFVKENNIDLFIDDSFKNCSNIANNTSTKVFLMNSKANEGFEDEKVKRVYSWPEIKYLIDSRRDW